MRRAVAAAGLALVWGLMGCGAKSTPTLPQPPSVVTPPPMPTVPMGTPTPAPNVPLATRPIKDPKADIEKRKGKDIGPVVTFAGIARADGYVVEPVGKNAQGVPIFRHPVGSGFIIVIEGKPGIGNIEVGRSIFRYEASDPTQRPDIEIESTRPLGDGSEAVCDARRPKIGGIPAVNPPSFAENPKITAALNDFSCRFETFIESNGSCTVTKSGDFAFARPDTKVQFCMVVARAWGFPDGDSEVSVRLRDVDGNPGPISRFILQHKDNPTPIMKATPVPTPTAPRRRE